MNNLIDLPRFLTQALDTARQEYARDNPASAAAFLVMLVAVRQKLQVSPEVLTEPLFSTRLFLLHLSMRTRRPRQPPMGSS